MKRTPRHMNIASRPLADGTIVYDVRLTVNKKTHWKYGYATLKEALIARDAWKLDIRQGRFAPAPDESQRLVHDVIRLRLDATVRRKAIRDTERMADWWSDYYRGLALKDVTVDSLEQARRQLHTTGRKGNRSVSTINRYMTFMRSVIRYGVQRGWLPFNPADQVKDYPEPDAPEYEITPTMEGKLYVALGQPYAQWARLAILTGLRAGEQFRLERTWIHLDDHHIRLPETKAGGSQIVFLSMEAASILRTIMESHDSPFIFPNKAATGPLDQRLFYNRVYKPAILGLGLKGYTWHTLRHTFCSRLARKARTFADLLAGGRWKDPKTALRYWHQYHAQVKEALEEASTIGAYLFEPVGQTVDDAGYSFDRTLVSPQLYDDSKARRGARVADSDGLENRCPERDRGFESHPLRQLVGSIIGLSQQRENTPNISAS